MKGGTEKNPMLDAHELECYFKMHNLSQAAINHIRFIRSSPPARRVKPYKSVPTSYPSRKMNRTIQAESHRVELPGVLGYEFSPHVLEFWDQPPSYQISYAGKNGRRKTYLVTQDFFVMEEGGIYWDQWKREEELLTLKETRPNYWVQEENGSWRSPPNEEYAAQFSFQHRVRSSKEINWNITSNIEFYKDYWLEEASPVPEDIAIDIIKLMRQTNGIRLIDLLRLTEKIGPSDYVHKMIADQDIYMDMTKYRGATPEAAYVFIDKMTHDAYAATLETREFPFEINYIDLQPGTTINWDGNSGTILNAGASAVDIRLEGGIEESSSQSIVLSYDEIESLRKSGRLSGEMVLPSEDEIANNALEIINLASDTEKEKALKRYAVVKPIEEGIATHHDFDEPASTIRMWRQWYREGKKLYGSGFAGLIKDEESKGNREPRYNDQVLDYAREVIKELYEDPTGRAQKSVFETYKNRCKKQGLTAVSRDKFYELIRERSGPKQDYERSGKRVAQQNEPWYWTIEYTTPLHGDRPWHICHIDHTQLDILLIDSETGEPLGKPWFTVVMDAYSRRILAVYLTYDPPSKATFMMTIRVLIKRHGRLPDYLIVDGGKDLDSVHFNAFLAAFECAKKTRRKPRDGNVIERFFRTGNTRWVHNLLGNTEVMKLVRQTTKHVLPENHAVWDIGSLYLFLQAFCYIIYDKSYHETLHQSPKEIFERGLLRSGNRPHKRISFDAKLLNATMPEVNQGGTRKVNQKDGIKVNNDWYKADELKRPRLWGKRVEVRYDPFNCGYVLFREISKEDEDKGKPKKTWLKAYSRYYSRLSTLSTKAKEIASTEIRQRHKQKGRNAELNGALIAEFMEASYEHEQFMKQRVNDREMHPIISAINSLKQLDSNLIIPAIPLPPSHTDTTDCHLEQSSADSSYLEKHRPAPSKKIPVYSKNTGEKYG